MCSMGENIIFDKFVVKRDISSMLLWYYYFPVVVKENLKQGCHI